MTDHKDRLEILAARGEPLGATALLERVGRDIEGTGALDSSPSRQMPGWMAAAAAFVLVLLVGGVWALMSRAVENPHQTTDAAGITWIELSGDDAIADPVFSGPGGFTRLLVGGGETGLQFSPDGVSWTDVDLDFDGPFPGAVVSSRTHWLVWSTHNDLSRGWVSTDGESWNTVSWPPGLENNVSTAATIDSGLFVVTRDVFGAGTQFWVSAEGENWVEVDPVAAGVERPELLHLTTAGLVDVPRVSTENDEIEVLISADGINWTASRITLPQSYVGESVRWGVDTVERLDAGWVAVGRIESRFDDPVVHVWVSDDGQNWVSAGVPPFGAVADRAVAVFYRVGSSEFLAIAPTTAPVAADRDGFISGAGMSEPAGELWTTANGVSWTRSIDTDAAIGNFAVGADTEGKPVGLWSVRPRQLTQPEIVETTRSPVVPSLEIDSAGIELQAEIVADGVVTEGEFREALDGWKQCMESFGIEQVEYEIDPRGGWGASWASNDDLLADAAEVACNASYVEQLTELLNG